MSFLTGLESIATKLEEEGHALAAKATGLFGTAEKLISGIVSELTPAIEKLGATVVGQVAELYTEGQADLKADLAEVKLLLAQATTAPPAPTPAPVEAPPASDVPVTDPAAPTA